MLQDMKKWNFRRRQRKHKREEKAFVSYQEAKHILLLFQSRGHDNDQVIFKIADQLKKDGKTVSAIGYANKKKYGTYHTDNILTFSGKETGLLGLPKQTIIDSLQSKSYDLLLNFSCTSILPLEYLQLYSNASCMVGARISYLQEPDLMIQMPQHSQKEYFFTKEETHYLFEQMRFYLKSIRSKH